MSASIPMPKWISLKETLTRVDSTLLGILYYPTSAMCSHVGHTNHCVTNTATNFSSYMTNGDIAVSYLFFPNHLCIHMVLLHSVSCLLQCCRQEEAYINYLVWLENTA
jgi:hypothetical protein